MLYSVNHIYQMQRNHVHALPDAEQINKNEKDMVVDSPIPHEVEQIWEDNGLLPTEPLNPSTTIDRLSPSLAAATGLPGPQDGVGLV